MSPDPTANGSEPSPASVTERSSSGTPEGPAAPKARKVPWAIIFVLLGSTIINYLDRLTVSVLAPTLRDEFGMSNTEYAWTVNAFTFSYMIFYSVGGRISDILGARRALTLFVVWWSTASVAQAFVVGPRSLAAVRFVLAMGEGGNWPTVIKSAAEGVPGAMRSFAIGIVNSGSALGAMLAPLIVGSLAVMWGWRAAFLATASVGFLWVPIWLYVTRNDPKEEAQKEERVPWRRLVFFRQAWAVFLPRLIGDPIWGFYTFWLPEYLNRARGLNLKSIALVAWIPFLAADLGNMAGGGITSWLIARGWSVQRARRAVMWVAAFGTMIGILAPFTDSLPLAIAAMSCAGFFFITWGMNSLNLPADWFPPSYVGTVLGFSGTGNGLGTLIVTALTGWVLDATGNYTIVFVGVGLLVPIAQLVLTLVGGPIYRLDIRERVPEKVHAGD